MDTLLISVFTIFGYPEAIRLDNASYFSSKEFADFMCNSRIQLMKSTAYNHDSNGEVERYNGTINETLACYEADDNWDIISPVITHTYNNQIHTVTKAVPYEVTFGRKKLTIERNLGLLNHLDDTEQQVSHETLIAEVLDTLNKNQEKKIVNKPSLFKEGDIVLKRVLNAVGNKGKTTEKYDGPYLIMSVDTNTGNCKLTKILRSGRLSHKGNENNRLYKIAHVKQLKLYKHLSGDE